MPTLNDGDMLIISRGVGNIKRGDIVVFRYPQDPSKSYIKRVIGLPGESIDLDENGNITINGDVLTEPYVSPDRNQSSQPRWRQLGPEWKKIEQGHYFIMGDNRDASNDSRSYGPVSKNLIYAKVFARYWPPGNSLK